jgi:hypothetical protein
MPMGTMTPEKGITIGHVDEHRTALFVGPRRRTKSPFSGPWKKSEETTLFRATTRGKPGSSLSFTTVLLFQLSYFSYQLREQPCFMIMLSGCSLFSTVSLMIRSNCMDCFYHRHLLSFFFYLTSHFPSLAYFHSEDEGNIFLWTACCLHYKLSHNQEDCNKNLSLL